MRSDIDIRELSYALRVLHQRLLASTQKDFEKLHGRVANAGELLQLAINDPLFAWLRPLSQRMAALDELAAAEDTTQDDVDEAGRAILHLLEKPGEFHSVYLIHLQSNPDVVMAHAEVRGVLRAGIG